MMKSHFRLTYKFRGEESKEWWSDMKSDLEWFIEHHKEKIEECYIEEFVEDLGGMK